MDIPSFGVKSAQKEGENIPIRWSALRVSEAMDMVEEFANRVAEPLEQAKIFVNEARNISDISWYLDQRLIRFIIDIGKIDYIRNAITAVRRDLPDEALETERNSESRGKQSVLEARLS